MRSAKVLALALATAMVSVVPAPCAFAQSAGEKAAAAQALFDEAMRLMKADQAAEACPKLEEAQRLDAGMATQFRLAECYEKVGKLAGAWASFVAVADAAALAKLPDREAAARKRADALAPRIPRLIITVPPTVAAIDGVDVLRDGVSVSRPLWGVSVAIDPGIHVVTAKAPGKKVWEARVSAKESAGVITTTVEPLADLPPVVAATPSPLPPPPPMPPPPPARSPVPTFVLGGVAVVGVVAGATLLAVHAGKSADAHALSAQIKESCVASLDPRCAALASDASSSDTLGNLSTVAFAAGGAAAAAMITYWLWPSSRASAGAIRLSPVVDRRQPGLLVTGSF